MSHTSLIAPSRGLEQLIARANTYISRARAASTVRAYRSDWNDFTCWRESHRLQFLPSTPETIALYITDLAPAHSPSQPSSAASQQSQKLTLRRAMHLPHQHATSLSAIRSAASSAHSAPLNIKRTHSSPKTFAVLSKHVRRISQARATKLSSYCRSPAPSAARNHRGSPLKT